MRDGCESETTGGRRKWLFNNPIWKSSVAGDDGDGTLGDSCACDPSNEGVSLSRLLINTDSPDNSQRLRL